jgi:hypothetical protein
MPNAGRSARNSPPRIGTERESSLHRALKFRYTGEEGITEASMGTYVCDGVRKTGEIIEVQTGSFGPLKNKVRELTALGTVRIIHPIIVKKRIELRDPQGILLYHRKSPREGSIWDLFKALIYAPELPLLPGLTIELALVEVSERRIKDGLGSWRRRGASIVDRVLTAYRGSILLENVGDYRRFIPFQGDEEFTVQTLGDRARISPAVARKTLYVLARLGMVKRTGKTGRFYRYRFA